MFEECKTLTELNQARVQKCSEGVPIVEVNNAYNNRKKELLSSNISFKRINTVPVKVPVIEHCFARLVFAGESDIPGLIRITPEGVYA